MGYLFIMKTKKTSVIYYSLTFLLSFTSVIALIAWLQWPLTAGIILGICILIQMMFLSKKVLKTWEKATEKNMTHDIVSAIKAGAGFNMAENNAETEI